ncbi:MAG TPA: hypothetical protein VLA93_03835 [Pyrinomonadaceae bacterium]|nr:hypothetical protein [Pyrinomonadaceae bacterium]
MSKQAEADLILKLYELRRESVMREARSWFFTFNPKSTDDFIDVLTSDKSAYYRMVTSYWDMAASLVNNGAIDAQMFNDANGEHVFIYAKLEPFLAGLRAQGNPQFLVHLEKLVKEMPNIEERLKFVRERIQKLIEMAQMRAAAKAAAASA